MTTIPISPPPTSDMRDPYVMALEIMKQSGDLKLLSSQVNQGLSNMTGTMNAQQDQLRKVQDGLHEIAEQLHSLKGHGSGLERLGRAIETMNTDNEKRWEAHVAEYQLVSTQLSTWRGIVIGSGVLVSMLIAAAVWNVQSEFQRANDDRARLERTVDTNSTYIRELQRRPQ